RRPEAIGEHRRPGGVWTVVLGAEEAARDRPQAHHLEEGPAGDAGTHDPRLTEADQREGNGRKIAKRAERLDAVAQVLELRNREVRVLRADAGGALADIDTRR